MKHLTDRVLRTLALAGLLASCTTTHDIQVRIRRPAGLTSDALVRLVVAPGATCTRSEPVSFRHRQTFLATESAMEIGSLDPGPTAFWVAMQDATCATCFQDCVVADVGVDVSVVLEPETVACSEVGCADVPDGGVDAGVDADVPSDAPVDAPVDVPVDAPVDVPTDASDAGVPPSITDIACGRAHTCAVRDGAVYCWGSNDDGEVGTGSPSADVLLPVAVDLGSASPAVQIAAAEEHTCARLEDGTVRCWGRNHAGPGGGQVNYRLGADNPVERVASPIPATLSNIVDLGLGFGHSCAADDTQQVFCWGINLSGELGDGGNISPPTPNLVASVAATSVAAGDGPSCAVTTDTEVWCWGYNQFGMLGVRDEVPTQGGFPAPVLRSGGAPLTGATMVTSGGVDDFMGGVQHAAQTCAIAGGDAYCWGRNEFGQAGLGGASSVVARASPVVGGGGVDDLTAGGRHTCLVRAREALCFGDNTQGQLGDGTSTMRPSPTALSMGLDVTAIDAGGEHTCVVVGGSEIRCWGDDSRGQLGSADASGSSNPDPVAVVLPDL